MQQIKDQGRRHKLCSMLADKCKNFLKQQSFLKTQQQQLSVEKFQHTEHCNNKENHQHSNEFIAATT